MKKRQILIIFSLIGGIIFSPYLFTNCSWITDLLPKGTSDISSAIGGITTPFVGLLSAYLVYLAFTEQIKANTIQREALDRQDQNLQREKEDRYQDITFQNASKILDQLQSKYQTISSEYSSAKNQANSLTDPSINRSLVADEAFFEASRKFASTNKALDKLIKSRMFSLGDPYKSFLLEQVNTIYEVFIFPFSREFHVKKNSPYFQHQYQGYLTNELDDDIEATGIKNFIEKDKVCEKDHITE
ncbi:hypothetical protein [Algivirga pacifica]|uniref:LemA family protein n=1 Tax=Algivirga pacifica TaxID=1162670 RepID=A0ABP9DI61_9BACT